MYIRIYNIIELGGVNELHIYIHNFIGLIYILMYIIQSNGIVLQFYFLW